MVPTQGITLTCITAALMMVLILCSVSGSAGVLKNRLLVERREETALLSIPGVEDKVIDCGCPDTCGDFDCLALVKWLMIDRDYPEANACFWASKNPDFDEETNSHRPCAYELCHPEGCNSYLQVAEHLHDDVHCGCPGCDDEALNTRVGPSNFTCGERIESTMHRHGVSQWHACDAMHFEGSCGNACDPKTCGSTLSHDLPDHAPWKEGGYLPGFTEAPTMEAHRPAIPSEEKETEKVETNMTEEPETTKDEVEDVDGPVEKTSEGGDILLGGAADSPTDSPTDSPAPLACSMCDDKDTKVQIREGRDCTTHPSLMDRKCNKSKDWIENEYCRLSCYKAGHGYPGDVCCDEAKNNNSAVDEVTGVESGIEEDSAQISGEDSSQLASDEFTAVANEESKSSVGTHVTAIVLVAIVCSIALVMFLERMYRVRKCKMRAIQDVASSSGATANNISPFQDPPSEIASNIESEAVRRRPGQGLASPCSDSTANDTPADIARNTESEVVQKRASQDGTSSYSDSTTNNMSMIQDPLALFEIARNIDSEVVRRRPSQGVASSGSDSTANEAPAFRDPSSDIAWNTESEVDQKRVSQGVPSSHSDSTTSNISVMQDPLALFEIAQNIDFGIV